MRIGRAGAAAVCLLIVSTVALVQPATVDMIETSTFALTTRQAEERVVRALRLVESNPNLETPVEFEKTEPVAAESSVGVIRDVVLAIRWK